MRNLVTSKIFVQEEVNNRLRAFDQFVEGGARVQLEVGRPTTLAEICVTVFTYGKEETQRQFYFPLSESIETCVKEMRREFAIAEGEMHTLYKCDLFE